MFERDPVCNKFMRMNEDWAVFFFFFNFYEKQISSHSKIGVAVNDFEFFTGTILQLELEGLRGLLEDNLFEVLLLGCFGSWLFIMNRMKSSTIKQKLRDVIASGVLGLKSDFKSKTLDKFTKGMSTFTGSFNSEKRALTVPLLMHSLPLVPKSRMGAQAGFSSPVATFCCLRMSEYTVSDSVTPNKFLTLRKVLYPVETNSPGKGNVCFHEKDHEANKE